jgi:hypothetical protein
VGKQRQQKQRQCSLRLHGLQPHYLPPAHRTHRHPHPSPPTHHFAQSPTPFTPAPTPGPARVPSPTSKRTQRSGTARQTSPCRCLPQWRPAARGIWCQTEASRSQSLTPAFAHRVHASEHRACARTRTHTRTSRRTRTSAHPEGAGNELEGAGPRDDPELSQKLTKRAAQPSQGTCTLPWASRSASSWERMAAGRYSNRAALSADSLPCERRGRKRGGPGL